MRRTGATLLLNCPHPPERGLGCAARARSRSRSSPSGSSCTRSTRARIAREAGLAGRIEHRAPDVLLRHLRACSTSDQAIARDQDGASPRPTAGAAPRSSRGNRRAVDRALAGLHRIELPSRVDRREREPPPLVPAHAPGVRAHGDRRDDGRPRRRPAGQRAAGRRHLPERHRGVREAQHLRAGRGLGPGPVHPVRQLQLRLPAQRDPLHATTRSRCWTGRRPEFRSAPLDARGLPGHAATRCRSTWRTAPAARCASRPARSRRRGDPAHKAINLADREPLREPPSGENIAFFESLPVADRSRGGLRHGARHAVPAAAVRVLRRLRRLRRDAVPEAALAALRRPADDRQRDRLLLDLRRQPAHDAVDHRRRRARSGLVQLAVRGQRRVRPRVAARRRPAHSSWPASRSGRAARGSSGAEPGRRRSSAHRS